MARTLAWLVMLGWAGNGLTAQASVARVAPAASPQADSAASARAAYRRAVAAYRQRDLVIARGEMKTAAAAWPTQQAYLEGALALAAAAGDTADAAGWLNRLGELGIGRDIGADTTFRALVGAPAFDSAVARHRRAIAPVLRGRVRLTLSDTAFHPEGVAYDARTRRWFMGSVTQRRIIALGPDRAARDLVASAADGIAGVFGMAVEADRRTLWVATTALGRMSGFTPADSGRAGVFGYDLDTGTLRRRVWLGRDALPHTLGDVAVAPNGDVYVSDSQSPWILKVPAAGDTLERFMTHPSFRSLQGLAVAADGGTMYVADYSHGLFRIDLTRRTAQAVRVPPGVTTLGIDGLYLHDGALVAVQNGIAPARVVRFCLDASGDAVRRAELLDRSPALADEPALGAVVGDSVFYIGTSQWEKFDDAGRRLPGTTARPATVIGVSLRTPTGCRTS